MPPWLWDRVAQWGLELPVPLPLSPRRWDDVPPLPLLQLPRLSRQLGWPAPTVKYQGMDSGCLTTPSKTSTFGHVRAKLSLPIRRQQSAYLLQLDDLVVHVLLLSVDGSPRDVTWREIWMPLRTTSWDSRKDPWLCLKGTLWVKTVLICLLACSLRWMNLTLYAARSPGVQDAVAFWVLGRRGSTLYSGLVRTCVCVRVLWACVHAEAKEDIGNPTFSALSLETRSFTEPKARLAGSQPWLSSCLPTTVPGLLGSYLAFSMGAESWTQVFVCTANALTS